jgi:hypothetical protein
MELLLNKQLVHQLDALPERLRDQVAEALDALAASAVAGDPRADAHHLSANPDIYEFQHGALRIPFIVERTPEGEELALALAARVETEAAAVATA